MALYKKYPKNSAPNNKAKVSNRRVRTKNLADSYLISRDGLARDRIWASEQGSH